VTYFTLFLFGHNTKVHAATSSATATYPLNKPAQGSKCIKHLIPTWMKNIMRAKMASLKVPGWIIPIFPNNYIIPNIGLNKGSKPLYYTQTTHFHLRMQLFLRLMFLLHGPFGVTFITISQIEAHGTRQFLINCRVAYHCYQ